MAVQVETRRFKIAVMGATQVGKSCIISQYVHRQFSECYNMTVSEVHKTRRLLDGVPVELDIIDTPGAYCFHEKRKFAIKSADAFILVYSLVDEDSIATLTHLRDNIIEQTSLAVPLLVVGNKTDLDQRICDSKTVEKFALVEWHSPYLECSAKTDDNVQEIFDRIIRMKYKVSAIETEVPERRMTSPAVMMRRAVRKYLFQ